MKYALLGITIAATLFSNEADARRIFCDISEDILGPKKIFWDEKTKAATIEIRRGTQVMGTIVAQRTVEGKSRINFIFPEPNNRKGEEAEFLLIENGSAGYIVIGAGFTLDGRKRLLERSYGNQRANCISQN